MFNRDYNGPLKYNICFTTVRNTNKNKKIKNKKK